MELDRIDAAELGRTLSGLGLNLLVRDVPGLAGFLCDVFGMQAHQVSRDFALIDYRGNLFQLHGDHTYHAHPLPGLLPEAGARGGGIELRLYGCDPDAAAKAAARHAHDAVILQAPADKPHGLREAVILCENGYAWVPGRALTEKS